VGGEGVENIDAQTFSPMWEGRRTLLMDCHLDGVVQLVRLFTVKVDQHDQNKDKPNEMLYREKRWEILHETKDMKRILNVLVLGGNYVSLTTLIHLYERRSSKADQIS
jgi:hypothetical protein